MNNFKVGDRVVCINDRGSEGKLKLNGVYTVMSVDSFSIVCLKNLSDIDNSWFRERFKLYNPCEDILQGILDE